jgi:hypothetical protein
MITDAQDLIEKASAQFGLSGPDLMQILKISKWSEVKDLQAAWDAIVANQEPK